jgi:hypothetical protein
MNRNRRTAILSLALLAAAALATAAPSATAPALSGRFPESADIRGAYWQSFFSASESELLRRQPSTVVNDYGAFRLSVTKSEGYLYAIASPEGAPLYAQGSWILKRSSPDGRPIQAKVFLRSDQGTFIRIYPDGDRSKMDLVVYGGVLNREVPLPVPFERCFVATMSEIRAWTGSLVDWRLFSPEPGLYRDLRSFVEVTRQRLPGLRYGDDGALGADGMPVYIETGLPQAAPSGLNCSGFAAWVADGFYWPMTEKLLDPMALAVRHADTRPTTAAERFEERLDPYFGLDWTRNIATALLDANYPSRKHGLRESDVTVSPFALVASGAGLGSPEPVNGASAYRSYAAYQEGLGYETVGLKSLLYVLAIRDPGSIYLASLSRKGGGEIAGLSRHYHVAVLAPYFEESGEFRVAAFESDVETSVEAIMKRTPRDFVHLVRIEARRDYDPPPLPDAPQARAD